MTEDNVQESMDGCVQYPLGCCIILGGMRHTDETPHKGIGCHHNLHTSETVCKPSQAAAFAPGNADESMLAMTTAGDKACTYGACHEMQHVDGCKKLLPGLEASCNLHASNVWYYLVMYQLQMLAGNVACLSKTRGHA